MEINYIDYQHNKKLQFLFTLTFIFFVSFSIHSQDKSIFINLEKKSTPLENLSQFGLKLGAITLKTPLDINIERVYEAIVNDDIFIVSYSSNKDSTYPDKFNIYDSSGGFIKCIKNSIEVKIDEYKKTVYYLNQHNTIHSINYSGNLIDSISLELPIKHFEPFNNQIYLESRSIKDEVTYSLHKFSLNGKKVNKIFEFKEKPYKVTPKISFFPISKLWVNETLFWSNGLNSHVYRIDKNDNITKIKISFPTQRAIMDQINTSYGSLNNQFYSKYPLNFKLSLFFYDLYSNSSFTSLLKLNDDIYNTGKFIFNSTQNNKIFFTKKYEELNNSIKQKFAVSEADLLIIFQINPSN